MFTRSLLHGVQLYCMTGAAVTVGLALIGRCGRLPHLHRVEHTYDTAHCVHALSMGVNMGDEHRERIPW